MSNKPFDLEKALAGEPVKLRDGSKAYVKYVMPDEHNSQYPLVGYLCDSNNKALCTDWTIDGYGIEPSTTSKKDIISMWEEPRPRVQLDLPCPLKVPQEEMWLLRADDIIKTSYRTSSHSSWMIENGFSLDNGRCFATKEDAQEWLEGMCNARR